MEEGAINWDDRRSRMATMWAVTLLGSGGGNNTVPTPPPLPPTFPDLTYYPPQAVIMWTDGNGTHASDLPTFTATANAPSTTSVTIGAEAGTDLPISYINNLGSLPNATSLYIGGNNLTLFDSSGMTALTYIDCGGSHLIGLSLSANVALVEIHCDNNPEAGMLELPAPPSPLAILTCSNIGLGGTFDLTGYTFIQTLDCINNSISSLIVGDSTGMVNLNCSTNLLTALDVSVNTALQALVCSYNVLSDINLSQNSALTSADISYNQIDCNADFGTFGITSCTSLSTFICAVNLINNLDITNNSLLTYLDCSGNLLDSTGVDNIIIALAGFGLSGGSLNTSGQNPAASPTPASAAALSQLNSSGWSVLTD